MMTRWISIAGTLSHDEHFQHRQLHLNNATLHIVSLAKKNEELTKYYIDRCLKGYSKTIMFVFSNNLRVFLAQFCGENATEREKFIGWSECGNKAKAAGTNRCWNRLLTNLWKTRLIEDSQDKVPAMCWYVSSV